MKKILMVTSEYPGNVSTFISRDIEIMCNNGYEVDLYPLYPLDESKWNYIPSEAKELILNKKLKVIHFSKFQIILSVFHIFHLINYDFLREIKNILADSKKYGKNQWKKSIYTILWTICLLNNTKKDNYFKVISYWGNYSGTAGYLFSKYSTNKPDFYTYLHAGVDLYRDQIYLLEKILYAKKVITVCEFNKKFLKESFPQEFDEFKDKVFVYHLPIKIKKDINFNKKENQFIAVGRLDKKKGLDYFLKASAKLVAEGFNFSVKIIGDGAEKENLNELVNKLKLNDIVEFLGHMPYNEVEKNIAESTVLVHSSPEIGDAVPTVIKESMSLGTPVIGTKIAGIPELLDFGKVGLLVRKKSENSIAEAMKILLNDLELQKKLSVEGKNFAIKNFNLEMNSKQLIEILNKD